MVMNNAIETMAELIGNQLKLVDLSHNLEVGMPSCLTHARFGRIQHEAIEYGDAFTHAALIMSEHTGTHMDAPNHHIPGSDYTIEKVPAERLFGRGAIIDASHLGKNECLPVEFIQAWEKEHGEIRAKDFVLFRFGWDKKWDVQPNCKPYEHDWPGLGREASEYLKDKGVSVVGTDALALDTGDAVVCPAHDILLGADIFILEALDKLDTLPPFCYIVALPLKVKDGSGAPTRVIALVE